MGLSQKYHCQNLYLFLDRLFLVKYKGCITNLITNKCNHFFNLWCITNPHCSLVKSLPCENNISPLPISCSAPDESKIVRESILLVTLNEILAGILAFIRPVMTFTDSLCS